MQKPQHQLCNKGGGEQSKITSRLNLQDLYSLDAPEAVFVTRKRLLSEKSYNRYQSAVRFVRRCKCLGYRSLEQGTDFQTKDVIVKKNT
jgi:hypothetical protein